MDGWSRSSAGTGPPPLGPDASFACVCVSLRSAEADARLRMPWSRRTGADLRRWDPHQVPGPVADKPVEKIQKVEGGAGGLGRYCPANESCSSFAENTMRLATQLVGLTCHLLTLVWMSSECRLHPKQGNLVWYDAGSHSVCDMIAFYQSSSLQQCVEASVSKVQNGLIAISHMPRTGVFSPNCICIQL